MPITSKSSNFKGETQYYEAKLPRCEGARQYCPKTQRVPGTLGGTLGTCTANSSSAVQYAGANIINVSNRGLKTGENSEKVGEFRREMSDIN